VMAAKTADTATAHATHSRRITAAAAAVQPPRGSQLGPRPGRPGRGAPVVAGELG